MAAFGSWERVREIVGHLMEPVDIYRRRWHVSEFPNEEQLRAIGKEQG